MDALRALPQRWRLHDAVPVHLEHHPQQRLRQRVGVGGDSGRSRWERGRVEASQCKACLTARARWSSLAPRTRHTLTCEHSPASSTTPPTPPTQTCLHTSSTLPPPATAPQTHLHKLKVGVGGGLGLQELQQQLQVLQLALISALQHLAKRRGRAQSEGRAVRHAQVRDSRPSICWLSRGAWPCFGTQCACAFPRVYVHNARVECGGERERGCHSAKAGPRPGGQRGGRGKHPSSPPLSGRGRSAALAAAVADVRRVTKAGPVGCGRGALPGVWCPPL